MPFDKKLQISLRDVIHFRIFQAWTTNQRFSYCSKVLKTAAMQTSGVKLFLAHSIFMLTSTFFMNVKYIFYLGICHNLSIFNNSWCHLSIVSDPIVFIKYLYVPFVIMACILLHLWPISFPLFQYILFVDYSTKKSKSSHYFIKYW